MYLYIASPSLMSRAWSEVQRSKIGLQSWQSHCQNTSAETPCLLLLRKLSYITQRVYDLPAPGARVNRRVYEIEHRGF